MGREGGEPAGHKGPVGTCRVLAEGWGSSLIPVLKYVLEGPAYPSGTQESQVGGYPGRSWTLSAHCPATERSWRFRDESPAPSSAPPQPLGGQWAQAHPFPRLHQGLMCSKDLTPWLWCLWVPISACAKGLRRVTCRYLPTFLLPTAPVRVERGTSRSQTVKDQSGGCCFQQQCGFAEGIAGKAELLWPLLARRVLEPQGGRAGLWPVLSQAGWAGNHRRTWTVMNGVAFSGTFHVLSHQLRLALESCLLWRRISSIELGTGHAVWERHRVPHGPQGALGSTAARVWECSQVVGGGAAGLRTKPLSPGTGRTRCLHLLTRTPQIGSHTRNRKWRPGHSLPAGPLPWVGRGDGGQLEEQ